MGKTMCQKCKGSGKRIGLEVGTGSMGLGLPAAVGYALSKKMKGEEGTVYCYMSDGEMQIGTTHEAALIASQHKLDNLVVVVERNGLQAMGETRKILGVNGYKLWVSWDWNIDVVNGHNYKRISESLSGKEQLPFPEARRQPKKPLCILADTTKGKGVSFMENDNLWHYAQLKEEDYLKAKKELTEIHI